jgi:PAS domain S-box-containing protein
VVSDPHGFHRRLVERSPDAICVVRNGSVEYANAAAARLFGEPGAEDLVGTPLIDRFHNETHRVHEILASLAQASSARFDGRIRRAGGEPRDVDVTVATLGDGDDAPVLFTLRDVTARTVANTRLQENEERLTLAFAGAKEGIWDWNLETNAVVYSTRWKQMLGFGDDEIEPHVSAWERLVHPDDRKRADEAHESVARGAQTYEAEFRLRHKDGRYVHVLSRGFPLRRHPDGPVVRIVGTHLDLTERRNAEAALRESEERLRLAFAGAQEGVWDWNLETGAVVYSARWKEMLGYADDEIEPHVRAWERLIHPDDRRRADEAGEIAARGGRYEGEFRLRHKDGHYVHVLSRGFPVRRDPHGPVVRIVGTHFDLTERKAAEAERSRTELLARLVFAQEDERRRIAREMHDQFGEQLTALARCVERLKDACGGRAELLAHVEALEGVSQQLDRDVDHMVWQLRPTALDDLGLRAALTNYVQDWSKRVNIAAALHTSGLFDTRLASEAETTLYRIAQEALTNVAKHSRATNVEVILERRPDHVVLIVEDDGVGFDPTANSEGFGLLGMQERAALVGATLEIESEPGRGTTILLRMAAAEPARSATPSADHV